MLQMNYVCTNRRETGYRFFAIFLCLILCVSLIPVQTAYAAGISVYNYTTKQTSTYTGTKVSYTANGSLIELNGTPGMIMSNGAAMGSYYDIFKVALGVDCKYDSKTGTVTFKTKDTTLVLTLGSKTAIKNGKKETISNAPTKYKFHDSGNVKVYVPTRYVAEALGFEYNWDSSIATSSIRKTISFTEYGVESTYNGNFLSVSVDGKAISYGVFPGIIKDSSAMVRIKKTFETSPIQAEYTYNKEEKRIVLKKGEITIEMNIGSNIAYVNGVKYIMEAEATILKCNENNTFYVMVPIEFVAEKLGYQVIFDEKTQTYHLNTTEKTGVKKEANDELEISTSTSVNTNVNTDITDDPSAYFNWKADEKQVQYYKSYGDTCVTQMKAVAATHSDALILYGITANNIEIVDDTNFIIIKIKNARNLINSEIYYNASNPYFNYCAVEQNGEDSILSVLKMQPTIYYSYDVEGACVIHFTERFEPERDYLDEIEQTKQEEQQKEPPKETVVLPDDCFIIPLPEGITYNQLSDKDNYENLSFTIYLPGNHADFLNKQKVRNPYGVVKSYTITYDSATNQTKLIFVTKKIQGYTYELKDTYLLITIATPNKIYDKIIVLDAGHGGIDPGAVKNKVQEKQINFAVINQYAKEYFDNSDIKVYYTRTTDTKIDLYERAAFASKVGADLFISFHVNAHNSSSVNGTSVYYSKENNAVTQTGLSSSILAKNMLNHMLAEWGTKNAGVLTEKFVVVHYNTVPAILVECAYITNASDLKKLTDKTYQKKAAKAIFETVKEIFETYPTKR